MTLLKVLNRALIFAAILAVAPLLFPTNIYSQRLPGTEKGTCKERIDGIWRVVPCRPDPTPNPTPRTDDRRDDYIPPPPPPEDPRLTEAREQNDLGIKAQNKGYWGIAADHFEQALAKDPTSAVYRTNLSNARRQVEIEAHRRLQQSLQDARKNQVDARGKGGLRPIGSGDVFGLRRSNPTHSDLRPLDNRIKRNFGEQPEWSQLNCAVDLLGQARSAAESATGPKPSFTESRNLLDEALNALNGDRDGVPCSMGRPLPRVSGRVPDLTRAVKKGRELIEQARIELDERIAKAYATSKKNEGEKAKQDAAAIEQARKIKRPPHQIVVPSPTTPPKPAAKPKTTFARIEEEARSVLASFRLKPRRSPTPRTSPK